MPILPQIRGQINMNTKIQLSIYYRKEIIILKNKITFYKIEKNKGRIRPHFHIDTFHREYSLLIFKKKNDTENIVCWIIV